VSISGLYIRIPIDELREGGQPQLGGELQVDFQLPEHPDVLRVRAEVVWRNDDDSDVGGRRVVGLGLRLLNPTGLVTEQLTSFVRGFRYSVLLIGQEGDTSFGEIGHALGDHYHVLTAPSAGRALDLLEHHEVSVLITGQRVADMTGLDLLAELAHKLPHAHVIKIVVSSDDETRHLMDFINVGKVFHYIRTPIEPEEVLHVVRKAIDAYAMAVENERLNVELERANRRLSQENAFLRRRIADGSSFDGILGTSTQLRAALGVLKRVCHTDARVHICGETGTGKELVARALHNCGERKDGPFVAQNCGAITDDLLASALFGHQKGSFTGADRDRLGLFREASGGTVFLDEVAELSSAMQVALLRVLQDSTVVPVGADQPVPTNTRLVSATHRDLREEVAAGRFREDLFFRLCVVTIELPPLRERSGDVELLARHFLDLFCERYGKNLTGFSNAAMDALQRYPWPGNVRELQNEVERAVVLGTGATKVAVEELSAHIVASARPLPAGAGSLPETLARSLADMPQVASSLLDAGADLESALAGFEGALLSSALKRCEGNRRAAARLLNIPRQTFQNRVKKRLG
jgi:two-component system response regulator HupR/HoxA